MPYCWPRPFFSGRVRGHASALHTKQLANLSLPSRARISFALTIELPLPSANSGNEIAEAVAVVVAVDEDVAPAAVDITDAALINSMDDADDNDDEDADGVDVTTTDADDVDAIDVLAIIDPSLALTFNP